MLLIILAAAAAFLYLVKLILDEPLNGLDEDGVKLIRNVLLEMKKEGATIVLSSHNPEDIMVLCDTVHRLQKGKLVSSHF